MGDYPTISNARVEANKIVDESLLTDLRDCADYNNEHAVRGGTDTFGVRLALARGTVELDYTGSLANIELEGTVTFATAGHADDGDPNFSSAPRIVFGFEALDEGVSVYETWQAGGTDDIESWSAVCKSITTELFTYRVQFMNDASRQIHGYLHWTAIGEVTSGE